MPKIAKSGNSIVVALPRQELAELGLKPGDDVIVRRRGSVLEVVPAELRPRLRPELEQLYQEGVQELGSALERLAK